MQIEGEAIVLFKKKLGENSLLVKLFSREQGIVIGAINNANSKSMSRVIQPGNFVHFIWQARLVEHLGILRTELIKPISFKIFSSQIKMHIIQSMLATIAFALPEGVPEVSIYNRLESYMKKLTNCEDIYMDYLLFEIGLLAELGFAIDMESCAVSNETENLYYISPKTGRAVTKEVGAAYHDKLFILPDYFISPRSINIAELLDGLEITSYFIKKHILSLKHISNIEARDNLLSYLYTALT